MRTITLEELAATLTTMATKFPYEINELSIIYDGENLETKIHPIIGVENIEINFTVEKTEEDKVPPPPPPPPPRLLKEE
jgi:hypothetical protein